MITRDCTWITVWIVSNEFEILNDTQMQQKFTTATNKHNKPAIVNIKLMFPCTDSNDMPLKSRSQVSLSEYLASNQAEASSW
mmetsp:Transcript_23456/g.17928  ORF Transcript_23456/g.17928 Transcript_23456/m.17928 type:complete len:82 (-) Transcript_23456:372-617(-)